jgi:alpha-tubulin suppressor-like RCC1 family protein
MSKPPLTGAVAVAADGTAKCWGEDDYGDLGVGYGMGVTTAPVSVKSLVGVKAIVAGRFYTCALKTDATVTCWGNNSFCDLGSACTLDSSSGDAVGAEYVVTPTVVSGISRPVTAISIGAAANGQSEYTCVLLSDGTVQCWGPGTFVVEQTARTIPLMATTIAGVTNVAELALSDGFACARFTDGTVGCWGAILAGQDSGPPFTAPSAVVTGLSGVVAIAAGGGHACALLGGGTVECWGGNQVGELGDGSTMNSLAPVAVNDLNGAVSIAAANLYSCAVLADGTVKCWGWYPGHPSSAVPTPTAIPGLTGVRSISAAQTTACVVVSGGRIECWGDDSTGQLGTGAAPPLVHPTSAMPVTVVSGS